jgi:hypothetical protein
VYEIRIREDVRQGVADAMVWAEVEAVVADGGPWQRTTRIVVEWNGGTWHAGLLPGGKGLVHWEDERAVQVRDEAVAAGLFERRAMGTALYLADGVTAERTPRIIDRLRVMAEAAACKH